MKKENEIPTGYTRVSSVLAPFTDFSKIDPYVLARKADLGTRVHNYCESYSLGLFVEDVDKDCKNFVDAFKKWFDTTVEEVFSTETRINSAQYRLSGQFDLLCKLKNDDKITLIDYKTPDNPSQTWQIQTAAYQILYEEKEEKKIGRRIVLMLPKKDRSARIVEYVDHEKDKMRFLYALELFRFFNG